MHACMHDASIAVGAHRSTGVHTLPLARTVCSDVSAPVTAGDTGCCGGLGLLLLQPSVAARLEGPKAWHSCGARVQHTAAEHAVI
jgi:hypothetical protein